MSRTKAARIASAIALLSLLLAACGGGGRSGSESESAPVATTDGSDPVVGETAADPTIDLAVAEADADPMDDLCSLIPADAAATALQAPVDGGTSKSSSTFDNASCRYRATDADASLTIWYHPHVVRDEWDETLVKTGMIDQQPIDELGDAAYVRLETSTAQETKLAVFAGGHIVWVIVASPADPGARAAAAESVARTVLAALA